MPLARVLASTLDDDLIRYAASFVNLRARDFVKLTDRSYVAVRSRLPKLLITHRIRFGEDKNGILNGTGIFYRLPDDEDLANDRRLIGEEYVYRLTQRGWDRAEELGFINHPVNATQEKSEGQLAHDMVLTDFHLALHHELRDSLLWSQLWQSRKTRWGKGADDYVNADAGFAIVKENRVAPFLAEIENQKGLSEPLRKMEGYTQFAKSGEFQNKFQWDDFRVIILKPTRRRALEVAAAANEEKSLNNRRFWISDYDSAINDPMGSHYLTPRDIRIEQGVIIPERTYSLRDA